MNKQKQNAFTLVELIVVITILAILGTIAFISLSGYSSQSRDATRLSDLSSMKTTLELFQLDAGKYPIPTNGANITYSGAVVWNQGSFGETVTSNVEKLNKKPTDPLTDKEYTYSVTDKKNEYQLSGMVEGDIVGMNSIITQTNAGETLATALVTGNYNGLMTKSSTGIICNVLSIPSIIASDITTSTDLVQIINNGRLVFNGYKNLPATFNGSKFKQDGGFAFVPNKILSYSDTGSCAALIDKASPTARLILLKGLQDSYSGTIVQNIGEIKNIVGLVINTSTPSNEVENYAGNFVNNNLGGSIIVSNNITTYSTCDFNGDTVTHDTSVTAYLTSSVTFGNTCTSESRLCNNGILSGTFTNTGCTVDGATGTFNLSQTTVTQGTNVTISNTCSQTPTSYTSSNTAVATVAGTTITTLSAGTTDITPVGGTCGDNVAKTLIVNGPTLYTNIDGSSTPYIPDGANGAGRFTLISGTVGNGGNGVVLDNITGLYWMSDGNVLGTKTWTVAKSDCAGLSLGGFTDWRLPDYTELNSIIDLTKSTSPSINTSYFSSVNNYYWSSTTYAPNTSYAWIVLFNNGNSNINVKTNGYYVRCTR